MGGRLGKLQHSYTMNNRNTNQNPAEEQCNKFSVDVQDGHSPESSSTSSSQESQPQFQQKCQAHDNEDQNGDGKSETTCASWRTRSENWSKKRRPFKSGTSSTKKDFFSKRNKKWPMRKSKGGGDGADAEAPPTGSLSCVCTLYRRTNSETAEATTSSTSDCSSSVAPIPGPSSAVGANLTPRMLPGSNCREPISIIDLSKFNPADYPIDDEDERMRQQRAKEMAEGVELSALLGSVSLKDITYPAHSQVDFVHYLVPDLKEITNCSFYWGKIDRYEAEKLLEGKPEGTFLLRDSAQEEYLFSVSFRRYGRSLHARIEQWNNQFSFDSHDPSVYSSNTVTGLIEHYKDPSCCMFFEPMLTTPLHRNFPFGLQHLARATICGHVKYDSINSLALPKTLKMYLKEYHYKQRVRVRRLE